MASVISDLLVRLGGDIAKFEEAMSRAEKRGASTEKALKDAFGKINSAMATLGVGLSVGGIVAWGDAAISSLSKINDLSKATNLLVEDLVGLSFAAKVSGGNLEEAAASVNKLAVNMGKGAERFSALGISARDPLEALKQLSDVFVSIQDPQLRAAVAAEALGKQWQGMAPLLAEGGKNIGELVEKGKALNGTTAALTSSANDLANKFTELTGNGRASASLMGEFLPILHAVADDLLLAAQHSREAGKGFAWLGEALRAIVIFAGNVVFVFKGVGREIGAIAAQVVALASAFALAKSGNLEAARKELERFQSIGEDVTKDAGEARRAFDEWEQKMLSLGTATEGTTRKLDDQDQVSRKAASDAAGRAREFLEFEERKKAAAEAAKKAAEARAKAEKEAWEEAIKSLQKYFDALGEMDVLEKKIEERILKFTMDIAENIGDSVADAAGKGMDAWKEFQREQEHLWHDVSDYVVNWADAVIFEGQSAFDVLKKEAKNFLRDMVAIFLRKWILDVAVGGGNSYSASLGSSVAGSAVLGVGNFAANWAAGGLGTAIGQTSIAQFWGGLTGAIQGPGLTGAAGAGSSLSGAADALMLIAGNIPVIGWIIAAAYALYKIFGQSPGGDKIGGSYFSAGAVPGTDNGRFFTPSQSDADVRGIVDATLTGYSSFASQLGGTPGSFGFGLGFDMDPQGTAQPRFSSLLTDSSGNRIYGQSDVQVDDKELAGALALEAKRAFVAMLQNTDLADALDALFDGIDVSSATMEELDAVLAQALEMKGVIDVLALWNIEGLDIEAIQAMQRGGETLTDTLGAVGQSLDNFYSIYYSKDENLKRQTEVLARQFEALGLSMPATREEFRKLVEQQLKDNPELARSLLELAGAFAAVIPAADDLGDAAADTADKIADAVELINSSYVSPGPATGTQSITDSLLANVDRIISASSGGTSVLGKLLLSRGVIDIEWNKLNKRKEELEAASPGGIPLFQTSQALKDEYFGVWEAMQELGRRYWGPDGIVADIARASELIDQFGEDKGSKLFSLEEWYERQTALAGDNQTALATLADEFTARWQEILDGAGDAAGNAAEEAKKNLAKWRESLLLSQISPLSPEDQLAEAKSQYEDMLALAQGGDVAAISGLSGAANTYLTLARSLLGSSLGYTSLFDQIRIQTGNVAGVPNPERSIADVLPEEGSIASSEDIGTLTVVVGDLITLIQGGITVNDRDANQSLRAMLAEIQSSDEGLFA